MKMWQWILRAWNTVHHTRTLVALAWLAIVLSLLSLLRGSSLVLVAVALSGGVLALVMTAALCLLMRLENRLGETSGANRQSCPTTAPKATQGVAMPQSAVTH